MCTSYHVFPEENIEMREIINRVVSAFPQYPLREGRVSPTHTVAVLTNQGAQPMRFGQQHPSKTGLLLNARSERVAHSPLFSPMLKNTRCLVPANEFYEWTAQKQPRLYAPAQGGLMYMAGLYTPQKPLPHFVIITRVADEQVSRVHHRMPLLLQTEELRRLWLEDNALAETLLQVLHDVPLLERAG